MKAHRSRVARMAAALTLAVAASFTVSACGAGPGPGVAAVTDGQVIREADLDAIAADFAKVQGAQAPSRSDMVALLVARPYVMEALSGTGQALTEEGVRQLLSSELPEASDATVRYIQAATSQQRLDQASAAQVQQAMASADIEVDPRYGEFDPNQGIVQPQENWIAPLDSQAPQTP